MESNESSGYYEFVWAKSYADIIENGSQYLKESLLQKSTYKFLCDKAGDSYHKVLEDLAVRNLTKEYPEKGFVSNIFPKANDNIDRYMDTISGSIYANCFDYYYLDSKKYRKAQSIIQLKNNSEGRIFVKRIGRKKDKYSLIDTLYCEAGKELTVADFSGKDYKKYDEIVLAFGYCETSGIGNYQLALVSAAAIDLYETVTGLKDLNPWEMNGNCITVHIEDLVEGAVSVTEYLNRAIEFADDNIETQEPEITSEYLDYFKNEINIIGEAVKKFGDKFQYKTLRFYMIPIENSTLSDEELHDAALNMMPNPKFKILDKVDDGIHVTFGGSVQPFSNTQIIAYVVITTTQGEKGMYRIEFDK